MEKDYWPQSRCREISNDSKKVIATFQPMCQRIESDFGNLRGIAIGNSQIAQSQRLPRTEPIEE